jgi:DNA-binding LacI/PurR family transcriptional regulator
VRPHKDVAVVGYDAAWPRVPHRAFNPLGPAASVDKCNAEAARVMVELLLDRIEGRLPLEPQRRLVTPKLVFPSEHAAETD